MRLEIPLQQIYNDKIGIWGSINTPQIQQEIKIRKEILQRLQQPKTIYQQLTQILSSHERLLLYLPNSLIPHVNEIKDDPDTYDYIQVILATYHKLAQQSELRADYTNGDTVDTRYITPVAKLIPYLINQQILPKNYSPDNHLQQTIEDDLQTTLPYHDDDQKRNNWLQWERLRQQTYKPQPNPYLYCGLHPDNLGPLCPQIQVIYDQIVQNQYLIPTLIIYGSHLKGYATGDSDLDLAVIAKPNAPSDLEQIINKLIPNVTIYWLQSDYRIMQPNDKPTTGTPTDSHVLLNGAWVVDHLDNTFPTKLLRPIIQQYPIDVLLYQLEKDLLQYRLLHRGYETYHHTTNPTYLDQGFKTYATKQYLQHILIP